MSKAPAMPMYWDAYLADTTHLTTEEHGAYMLLLAAMWRRNGSVPDDDKDNARILGLTVGKWRKTKARFIATISGFEAENGEITQEKLRKTWENTQEKIAKNASNGAKGGRPKGSKNKQIDKANGSISVNPIESIPEPEPEPEIEVDKSTSIQEAENYQRYLEAHPKPVESDAGAVLFSELIADGVDPEQIIGAAKAYAETVRNWSAEAKVQQSDNFLDPERGKWKAHVPKAKATASIEERLTFWADSINGDAFVSQSCITSSMAAALIDRGLVTPERMKERGIAA